jgi:alpha-beta hydrolase superfamily lysophospholipase
MKAEYRSDHFAATDGLALRRLCWSGPNPTRLFALVHGLAEHAERYEMVAGWLVERGYRVYAYDQRGHGASPGPRTHARSFGVLLDDLERFLQSVREENRELPLILCGHSMGGLEVATFLADRRPPVDAAILSGPGLALGTGLPRRRILTARFLSRLLPRMRISAGIDPTALSRDPAVQEAYRTDPRIPKTLSARLIWELLRAVERVGTLAPSIDVPLLLLHGEVDPLCAAEGSRRFHAGLRSPGSEVILYPGLRHEILNEPERERVLEDAVAWISKRTAGPSLS